MAEQSSPYQVSQSGMSPVAEPSGAPVIPTAVPKVFGIINIVYACLGVMMGLASVGAMFAFKAMMRGAEGEVKEAKLIVEAFDDLMIYSYIDVAFKVVLGLVLLVAGIGLLKKKMWGQKMCLFWAIARMLVAVGMMVWTLGPTREFQEKINQVGGEQQEQIQQMAQGVGSVMSIVFICIYPVLCLVFLTKKKVKDSLS
jgi:hypothetical protein